MKTSEKAGVVGIVAGVAAGLGVAYLLPDWHWGFYLAAGFIVMGIVSQGITQSAATDRVADGDLPAKDKG